MRTFPTDTHSGYPKNSALAGPGQALLWADVGGKLTLRETA